ncbi:MAG TPA: PadR family transcriptional regulator [Candidatus Limnocylindrales bacterium]|nr:PadR family transcriptional regulator [Candidatus Limnocylindrales bacterium]
MFRESHTTAPHHPRRHRHHDDPATQSEPYGDGVPNEPGPGRGRGRGHRHGGGRGPAGPGFGPGGFGPGGPGGPGGFGPRGRRRRPKGAVREAILSLLADSPANGYSLMKQIAERAEGEWSPSPGSVYPTLAQLVDEGLIEATGTGKGTDFTLTPQGREYVEQNADELAAIWAESTRGAPTRAAMRDSIGALMGVIQQFRFATDDQRQQADAQLDETRRALHRILAG